MKKLIGFLTLVIFTLILTGCPYSGEFPIDEPGIKIENAWLGKYTGNMPSDYMFSGATLVVTKNSSFEYKVTSEDDSKKPEDREKNKGKGNQEEETYVTEYIAHVSMLDGQSFLNVKEMSGGSYYIFRADRDGKSITLKELTPVLKQKASNATELKEIISRNMNNELLYGAEFTLTKK